MTTSPPQHGVTPVKHEASPRSREGRRFPGWRWVAVWLAFPVAGYIGWIVGGRVDAVGAALVGGALTGAGIGAVQWWAADGALGRRRLDRRQRRRTDGRPRWSATTRPRLVPASLRHERPERPARAIPWLM